MRHVYRIDDGGEWWDWSAESDDSALAMHMKLNYEDAGISKDEWPDDLEAIQMEDAKSLTVRDCDPDGVTITRTCREWADAEEGLVGTTCE